MERRRFIAGAAAVVRRIRAMLAKLPTRMFAGFVTSLVLMIFGLAIVALAVALLVRDIQYTRKPKSYLDADPLSSPSPRVALGPVAYGAELGPSGWSRGSYSHVIDNILVTFEFTRLRVEARAIQANVRVYVPIAIRRTIRDGRTEAYAARGGSIPFVYDWQEFAYGVRRERVRPEYANKRLRIQVVTPGLRAEPLAASPAFTMEQLFDPAGLANHLSIPLQQQVELPLTGWSSASYPNDWYAFEGIIYTSVDDPLGVSSSVTFPVRALTVGDDLLEQRVTTFRDPRRHLPISVFVERDITTVAYVYAMSLVPVGFALLLLHQLFLRRGERVVGDALAAIVAAVLTVLGIRQVLVPPFIDGITRVDLILGVGLALVLSLAFTRYVIDQWMSSSTGERSA